MLQDNVARLPVPEDEYPEDPAGEYAVLVMKAVDSNHGLLGVHPRLQVVWTGYMNDGVVDYPIEDTVSDWVFYDNGLFDFPDLKKSLAKPSGIDVDGIYYNLHREISLSFDWITGQNGLIQGMLYGKPDVDATGNLFLYDGIHYPNIALKVCISRPTDISHWIMAGDGCTTVHEPSFKPVSIIPVHGVKSKFGK